MIIPPDVHYSTSDLEKPAAPALEADVLWARQYIDEPFEAETPLILESLNNQGRQGEDEEPDEHKI